MKQITKDRLIVGTPAKVNLFLEVLRRRDDGYHDINSLFQAVSLFDRLEFRRQTGREIRIELKRPADVPLDDSNLVARAFHLMCEEFALESGLAVRLEKNIPVAAGLGGGSADAAATILACNTLFGLGLSRRAMQILSLRVGSDLPFFFSSGQAIVTGRGEQIRETEFPRNYWLVLVTPRLGISSTESYGRLGLGLTKLKNGFRLHNCESVEQFVAALRLGGNDFEKIYLASFPDLGRIREELFESGAELARMSGSGPTMFGIYWEVPDIEQGGFLRQGGWQVNTVRPISLGGQ